MDLFTSLLIIGIILIGLMVFIPYLIVDIVGQLLLSRPDDYEGWCYYGKLLERRGRHFQAYSAYLKSIEINPSYAEAHERLDDLILIMQNEGESTDALRQPDLDPM
jgi:tetratricopeptide (TPR) repeat protein